MPQLFQTQDEWSLLMLRVVLGIVIFAHGAPKVFGWFGGRGLKAAMTGFTVSMHLPWFFALLAILAESLGPLGLLMGFLTRVAALGILCEMIVPVWLVHWPYGFFMNWWGKQKGEGFEYHLLVVGISFALLLAGGGKWSVDRWIAGHKRRER